MSKRKLMICGCAVAMFVAWAAEPAKAVFVSGTDARATFDDLVANFDAVLMDFESFTPGTNLTTQVPGMAFESVYFFSTLNPPEHVEVTNRVHSEIYGNTIIGSWAPTAVDDGRVIYQIVFDTPHPVAGIFRYRSAALTTFYNTAGVALHTAEGSGFHGAIIESDDPADWVKRIYIDGQVIDNTRSVGISDDLIYGDVIPEPAAWSIGVVGVGLILRRRR
ncbi:hypothetical protein HED60_16750 [Planctomycetales bacterium ZRK34]|nr:hypothetical protein HED60_16750 [Planctomycetales bacterium ZRK34]